MRQDFLVFAAATTTAAVPRTNDYTEVSTAGKVCPESGRIPLACGQCGPNWGDLTACEQQCNAVSACNFVTYFDDHGCRIYSACALEEPIGNGTNTDTQIYQRSNPKPVPVPTRKSNRRCACLPRLAPPLTPPPPPLLRLAAAPPAPTPPPPTPPPTIETRPRYCECHR